MSLHSFDQGGVSLERMIFDGHTVTTWGVMRTRLVSLAALLVDGLYLREILLRMSSLQSHTSVVRAALSVREYTAVSLLLALTITQAFLCVALLLPQLYSKIGALSSCMTLAATSLLETMMYGSLVDSFHTRKVVLTVCTVTILGLFRNESRIRNTAMETPIENKWVNIHASIRISATRFQVAKYAVPLSCLSFIRMIWFLLSSSRGLQAEVDASAAATSASVSAMLLILAGLDSSDSLQDLCDLVIRNMRRLRRSVNDRKSKKL